VISLLNDVTLLSYSLIVLQSSHFLYRIGQVGEKCGDRRGRFVDTRTKRSEKGRGDLAIADSIFYMVVLGAVGVTVIGLVWLLLKQRK